MTNAVNAASNLLRQLALAERVVILTGAGISAESGVPTFRQAQTGLWARFRPEDLATPEAFERDPALVWRWYQWRRRLIRAALPNAGHVAIARLATLIGDLTLITQNVDDLHQTAGSAGYIALHGNIFRNRCPADGMTTDCTEFESVYPPPCPRCSNPVRPDVVWFGESLDSGMLAAAIDAASAADLLLSVGTSSLVRPAADLPLIARNAGAKIAEVNPAETPLSGLCNWFVREPAAHFLPQMVEVFEKDRGETPSR